MDAITYDLTGSSGLYGLPSYLNPFIDYSTLFQPATWHNALRWCHHPNTYVETRAHWFLPITDVQVGDEVWTHEGWRPVTNVFKRHYAGEMIEFRPAGLPASSVTPDHQLYIWHPENDRIDVIHAIDLCEGDWVICPRQQAENFYDLFQGKLAKQQYTLSDLLELLFEEVVADDYGFALTNNNILIPDILRRVETLYKYHRLCESAEIYSLFNKHDLICRLNREEELPIAFTQFGCARQICELHVRDYAGDVYSLTVDGPHNYVANGWLSRNCEYIVSSNEILNSAIERVISFFITDIDIKNVPLSDKEKIYDFLVNQLSIKHELGAIALDYITYGNVFISLNVPFIRILHCNNCHGQFQMRRAELTERYKYDHAKDTFFGRCLLCNKTGELLYKDLEDKDINKYTIKRWPIYEMLLDYDEYSGNTEILWEPSPTYKTNIQEGHLLSMCNAPKTILKTIYEGAKLHIHRDKIFFGKDKTLSGLRLRGWGLSRVFRLLRAAWNYQMLNRANEAVAVDFILPLRVVVPQSRFGGEGGDPVSEINLRKFSSEIGRLINIRRRDPTRWLVSPYPLDYKTVGGDGRLFAPVDLIERSVDRLLNAAQVPAEFYRGTMTMQAAPVGLRIMNSLWGDLVTVLNQCLAWLKNQFVLYFEWDSNLHISLAPPTHVDDINRQMLKTQLMMSGILAQGPVLKSLGEDIRETLRQKTEEQLLMAEEAERAKKIFEGKEVSQQLAQGQMGGMEMVGMAGPGMPPLPGGPISGGGGAPPAGAMPAGAAMMMTQDPVQQVLAMVPPLGQQKLDPQEMDAQATQIAQMIWSMPETAKDSVLRQLKAKNETYWMVVKEKLNDMYSAARRQGVIMSKQPM